MSRENQPAERMTFEIERYRGAPTSTESHVAFSGTLEKHPHKENKIVLLPDPFSAHLICIEFNRADIGGLEELPSLVTAEGETVSMFRVWVKKGSLALQCVPFVVEDIAGRWNR